MNFDKLFKIAKEKGLDDAQIFYTKNGSLGISIFEGEVEKYTVSSVSKLSVKGIYKGQMGYYSTEEINEDLFEDMIDKVILSASATTSKEESFIYEGDDHYEKIELYNPSLDEVSVERKIELVKKLEANLRARENTVVVETEYSEDSNEELLQNSKGLKLENKGNVALVYCSTVLNKDGSQRDGDSFEITNDFNKFNIENQANEAYDEAKSMLGAKPIESGKYEAVIKNSAFRTLLSVFSGMFSSENVQRGLSPLGGKEGEIIGSELVTIVDDPFLKDSITSTSFDSEGVATKYKELVKNWKLEGFLYNLSTAKKAGVKSTGNGFGGSVRPTNLYLKPGSKSYEELVESLKDGVVITSFAGAHAGANAVSGDFSLQVSGYRVKDGKIVQPMALVTGAHNFLELLKMITEVGNDLKPGFGNVLAPSVKISSITISGK